MRTVTACSLQLANLFLDALPWESESSTLLGRKHRCRFRERTTGSELRREEGGGRRDEFSACQCAGHRVFAWMMRYDNEILKVKLYSTGDIILHRAHDLQKRHEQI